MKGESTEYRFLTPIGKDLDACVDIFMRATGSRAQRSFVRKMLTQGLGAILIAGTSDGRVVGLITGLAIPDAAVPPRIELTYVVDADSAHHGVNRLLVDAFIAAVRRQAPHATFVDVSVTARDTATVTFYSHLGFTVAGFLRGERGDDILTMRRSFTPAPTGHVA